jgi:mannose-6-phosphate isomerase-like protein (cupin superfamily)
MSQHNKVSVKILEKNDKYEITIENIEPNGEIFKHHHPDFELEVILSGTLYCNGLIVKLGTVKFWKPNEIHGYQNKSKEPAEVLSIYYGKWTEEKEILE